MPKRRTLRRLLAVGSFGLATAAPLTAVGDGPGFGEAAARAALEATAEPTAEAAAGGCHSLSASLASDKWCVSNCALGNCPQDLCSSSCSQPGHNSVSVSEDGEAKHHKTEKVVKEKVVTGGNCAWVGNGANGAYCTQWSMQSIGHCSQQDICTDGSSTTAHYGTTCSSLGFTRSHHEQTLTFGSCGGTEEERAAQVYLYPGPKLEAKSEAYCSWVGSVTDGGAYCSQWPLQRVGICDGVDICTDGKDVDPPYGVTKAHFGMTCKSLGYTREATYCSRCVGGKRPNMELLNFGPRCGGSPDERSSAIWVHPRPPYNCSTACVLY